MKVAWAVQCSAAVGVWVTKKQCVYVSVDWNVEVKGMDRPPEPVAFETRYL